MTTRISPLPSYRRAKGHGDAGSMGWMHPMMMVRVAVMMPVVRRIGKTCRGKQQQRSRDSDELTHDSTLI
jgi:hypothetical protein